MDRKSIAFTSLALVVLAVGTTRAQEQVQPPAAVAYECCDCCCGGGWYSVLEGTVFKYTRADGTRVGSGPAADEQFDTDYFISPRVTVGYMNCNGIGLRARYWEHNHTTFADDPGVTTDHEIGVDTYTLDVEAFGLIDVGCWTLEVSGGVRYNDFYEVLLNAGGLNEPRTNEFSGLGGVVGMEAMTNVGCNGALYGRLRGAIIVDDKRVTNLDNVGGTQDDTLLNSTQGMWEIAVGYQHDVCWNGCIVETRVGVEWQNWYNYSSAIGLDEATFEHPSDVGFFGYTFSAAVAF